MSAVEQRGSVSPIVAENPWGTSLSHPCPHVHVTPLDPCPRFFYPCSHPCPHPVSHVTAVPNPILVPSRLCSMPHCPHAVTTPVPFLTAHLGCPLNCDAVLSLSPCPCQPQPRPCPLAVPAPMVTPCHHCPHPGAIPIPTAISVSPCPHPTHCPHSRPSIPTPIPVPAVSLTPSLCHLPCPQVSPPVHRCRSPVPNSILIPVPLPPCPCSQGVPRCPRGVPRCPHLCADAGPRVPPGVAPAGLGPAARRGGLGTALSLRRRQQSWAVRALSWPQGHPGDGDRVRAWGGNHGDTKGTH